MAEPTILVHGGKAGQTARLGAAAAITVGAGAAITVGAVARNRTSRFYTETSAGALILVSSLLLVVACSVRDRPEHRWTGPLTASKPGPECPPTKGVLILRDGVITFAPDEGAWVLSGVAGPTTLTATRSRPVADHKIYRTDLKADWTDASVHGAYTTPGCTYRVDLARY